MSTILFTRLLVFYAAIATSAVNDPHDDSVAGLQLCCLLLATNRPIKP